MAAAIPGPSCFCLKFSQGMQAACRPLARLDLCADREAWAGRAEPSLTRLCLPGLVRSGPGVLSLSRT